MSGHGLVAIEPERLEAFADALHRCADAVLSARLDAVRLLAEGGEASPGEVLDLGPVSSRLRALGHDTRRRLELIRNLPWELQPMPTSVLVRGDIARPYDTLAVVDVLLEHRFVVRAHDVGRLLDALLDAAARDPYEAAAALGALGVDGFRRLYDLAASEASVVDDDVRTEHLQRRIGAITGLFVVASRTVDHPGGLPRAFVDELFAGRPDLAQTADEAARQAAVDEYTTLGNAMTALGAGDAVVAAAQRAASGTTGPLVTAGGRFIAVAGLWAGMAAAFADDGEGLAPAVVSGALGVIGAFASGPVGWIATGLSFVLWMLSAPSEAGTPPRRSYPSDQPSPGSHGSETWLDGAGIPVAPNGV